MHSFHDFFACLNWGFCPKSKVWKLIFQKYLEAWQAHLHRIEEGRPEKPWIRGPHHHLPCFLRKHHQLLSGPIQLIPSFEKRLQTMWYYRARDKLMIRISFPRHSTAEDKKWRVVVLLYNCFLFWALFQRVCSLRFEKKNTWNWILKYTPQPYCSTTFYSTKGLLGLDCKYFRCFTVSFC